MNVSEAITRIANRASRITYEADRAVHNSRVRFPACRMRPFDDLTPSMRRGVTNDFERTLRAATEQDYAWVESIGEDDGSVSHWLCVMIPKGAD
jgi:hypothetical protein